MEGKVLRGPRRQEMSNLPLHAGQDSARDADSKLVMKLQESYSGHYL